MAMNRQLEIGLAVVVALAVLAGGGYALLKADSGKKSGANATASSDSTTSTGDNDAAKAAATITYTDSGFSPATITVHSGDTIAIKNTSATQLDFESGPHPGHTSDTELNVGTVQSGKTETVTVTTKGEFSVHNHLNPSDTATVRVQ